ncbi:MAG: hypothetical protein V4591_03110 [Bdellovibrionota bacterium]
MLAQSIRDELEAVISQKKGKMAYSVGEIIKLNLSPELNSLLSKSSEEQTEIIMTQMNKLAPEFKFTLAFDQAYQGLPTSSSSHDNLKIIVKQEPTKGNQQRAASADSSKRSSTKHSSIENGFF